MCAELLKTSTATMELKPYFGLSKKGLTLLRRDHNKKLNTMVAHIDNTPFVPPESSPLRHKISHLNGNNKKSKKGGKRKYAIQQISEEQTKIEIDEANLEKMVANIEEQIRDETNHTSNIAPQQISYYDTNSTIKIKCRIPDNHVSLDRDQIRISSSVLNNTSNRMKLLQDNNIEEHSHNTEHNKKSSNKYTRLKNEKKRRKIQKWQETFEMNGIIASKADLTTYERFIGLLLKLPTSANRLNIIKMASDDASIAEGEALLLSDFC